VAEARLLCVCCWFCLHTQPVCSEQSALPACGLSPTHGLFWLVSHIHLHIRVAAGCALLPASTLHFLGIEILGPATWVGCESGGCMCIVIVIRCVLPWSFVCTCILQSGSDLTVHLSGPLTVNGCGTACAGRSLQSVLVCVYLRDCSLVGCVPQQRNNSASAWVHCWPS
jgi:hypothetical protein